MIKLRITILSLPTDIIVAVLAPEKNQKIPPRFVQGVPQDCIQVLEIAVVPSHGRPRCPVILVAQLLKDRVELERK